MASIRDIIHAPGYKPFMKKLLIYASIVFVLGIVFLLCKWPGGDIMIKAGGGTLVVWLVFFVIEKVMDNNS